MCLSGVDHTKQSPLGGAQIVTMVTARTRGHLRPPSVPRQCPRDVWDLILACTLPDPSHRPAAKGSPPLLLPRPLCPALPTATECCPVPP